MIFIVVRETTDWRDEAVFRAQLPRHFAPFVDLWNATFDMPYHAFRHELKRIAELNWSRVEGARVVPLADVPAGAVVVPTDDDDWFSPGLAAPLEGGPLGWRWQSRFLEVPINLRHRLGRIRRAILPRTKPKWFCTTNNYAFVQGALPPEVFRSHETASEWFEAHPGEIGRIDLPLSVMNRTLSSQTTLIYAGRMHRGKLLRKYRSYRKLYRAPPAALPWSAPYVKAMADLMDHLHPRPASP